MRLLKLDEDGAVTFAEFFDKETPPYAILSHTWEDEEVTFKDLLEGTAQHKAGYKKILFCGEQSAQDNLQHFWVDTCSINKSDSSELSEALNSMFRWYQNATKCYVYMSDVSRPSSDASHKANQPPWESAFARSRWFTRGWTLQELIAPASVEFFSKEGEPLGNKRSLEMPIQKKTGIPVQALRGSPLSDFSVEERLSWAENRETTRQEDKAYSLLGIFEVFLPPIYGEGEDHALGRLRDAIDKSNKCLRDLRLSDPQDDMNRIINNKGGLLEDSYRWIIDNSEFRKWRDLDHSRLLWVKGDPGKGKTMLLCGIVKELRSATPQARILKAFFFFQAADSRINSAASALRGLIYQLVVQQPSLISHVRKKYDPAGKRLFEDANAWMALVDIFTNILRRPGLKTTYLIIDALDECVTDRQQLLDFIADKSSESSRVKWIVSSRNWSEIEERLRTATEKVMLSLELNEESISTAVRSYIEHKVTRLTQLKNYDEKLRNAVQHHLSSNANDTFLWVALVCEHLDRVNKINTLAKLKAFPPGLNPLYKRMMDQICDSDNADLCKQILAIMSTVYRPLTFKELTSFVEMPEVDSDDCESQSDIISLCGSFLTLREGAVYFVHQSAKDFLIEADQIFPSGMEHVHHSIFSMSLDNMLKTLQRDVYNLNSPGFPIDQVIPPEPDPLAASRYSCIRWVNHLCDSRKIAKQENSLLDGGVVDKFLRKNYLHWLEALSLLRSVPEGIIAIEDLRELLRTTVKEVRLTKLVEDAYRFIRRHKLVIEDNPLQIYASTLMFSPVRCLTRELFKQEEPKWITIKPDMDDSWSSCLQTLEGHSDAIASVAFSHNGKQVISASDDSTLKIWDVRTGKCLQTLKGHSNWVRSVAFSHDDKQVVSASLDLTAKIWDAQTGKCLQTLKDILKDHTDTILSAAFSHDSKQVILVLSDLTIKIWNMQTGKYLQTLEGTLKSENDFFLSVAFSHNSKQIASSSSDLTVTIWDVQTGKCLQILKGHSSRARSVAFSPNDKQIVSVSGDRIVKIWDVGTGKCLQTLKGTLKGHSGSIRSVAFSHNGKQIVSAEEDSTVKIWDTQTGKCLQVFNGHSGVVFSATFSVNSKQVVSASDDLTVKIWDTQTGKCPRAFEGHSKIVNSVAFSHNSKQIVSAADDFTVKIWDTQTGKCLQTLKGHTRWVKSATFSYNGKQVVSAAEDSTVKIWDTQTGKCLQTLGHSDWVRSAAFSLNGKHVVSVSAELTVKIWDAGTGKCLETLYIDSSLQGKSFDLHTEIGTIGLDESLALNIVQNKTDHLKPIHQGYGLSSDGMWITQRSDNLLLLPFEYRANCSAVAASKLVIGCCSGRVLIFSFR